MRIGGFQSRFGDVQADRFCYQLDGVLRQLGLGNNVRATTYVRRFPNGTCQTFWYILSANL